ncbi:MAG: L-seryl-tRNA selenium transferase, partial [Chloroflexi bacterium]|nr:L-seryl-tRNA selenium transferase [Chloroflexota bacterium]
MTNWSGDPDDIYSSLGVKRVITASGTTTQYGGSKMRPEIMEAMNKAASMMVNIDDLNRAASKAIADATGAEAGFVSGGSASGLVLQAAAVVAGSDPARMRLLPDT